MCHDFSTISTPSRPTGEIFLPARNKAAMRNQEKSPQVPFFNNHFHNMRSPVMQQGLWMKQRETAPVHPGMPAHPTYTIHNINPNGHYTNNRRSTPTMTNKNNFSPRLANNYRRRTHSETLPARTPTVNVPKQSARVSLLASPTQFAKHNLNTARPKLKTVAVPLTCEEVEAQASRGKFRGPLTCDEVELLQASSALASAQQPELPNASSPTPSSSSGYESISGLLSVIIDDDDHSDILSSPSSPMSDSVFCSFDQMPVMQSSPSGKAVPSSPSHLLSRTPATKEDILNSTLIPIYNPDDDGYSSSDSVDKFFSAQIANKEVLSSALASNDTKSSKSSIKLPSSTDNWQTSVEAVGLPCQFLSSKDTTKNNINHKPSAKSTANNKNKKGKKEVPNALVPKAAFGVMPTICSSPPQATNLPMPPNMWVKPTNEPSSPDTKRVDVTGLFTTLLSRANSPVASSTEQTLTPGMASSNIIGVLTAGEGSTLESMCSEDGGLGALFSSLHIQTRDKVMAAKLYNSECNFSTNDCALGVLKQNLHGIHRNFNLLCNTGSHGTVAA